MTLSMRSDHFRSEVEHVDLYLEQRFEYDINFLQDRFVYLARSGGQQGYSAVGLGYGALEEQSDAVMAEIRSRKPDMRRTAIDGALGLGYERSLRERDQRITRLADEIRWLRRPLRRKVADFLTDFWCQIKAVYS